MLFQTTPASRQIYTPGTNSNGSGLVSFDTSNTTLTTPASSPLGNPHNSVDIRSLPSASGNERYGYPGKPDKLCAGDRHNK